ncbi:MAG: hypothetical protein A2161_09270 [Candidatus Schekmanbacteria bacterium RBG_13_48_7]|uniref:Band 7 domain-containing protein n=1 Tax=Candidatus Schekmanbacteria bacterium RBG_13_48_7 TaxID=1817878 RepID=A0A1F7RXJ1_9BACT|nr:MAG: hypothetical protein A2161_09270 [Candidatus Schekmanbacteria bacterium RBG_13_48_7]
MSTLITVIIVVVVIALLILAASYQYKKVGPNQVLIIAGGRKRKIVLPDGVEKKVGYRIRIGGGTFIKPIIERYEILPLDIISMQFQIPDAISMNGIKSMINGTAQVKIDGREEYIHLAAEQFLGKSIDDIRQIALKDIEGHTRAIIGTMNLESINKNRKDFAARIQEEVGVPFNKMGLKLISYNLTDIKDPMGYLEALGKPKIAEARRTAEIAESENMKEAIIKSAAAKKEGDIAKLMAEIEVSEAQKNFEVSRASYQSEINQKKAYADYTYDLEKSRMAQLIKKEEYALKLIEKEQSVILEEKEIDRKEKELISKVRKPAEAEKFRIETEAHAMAEAKRIQGLIESETLKSMGAAEAESMQKKAEAWQHFNQAAILQMFFNILPGLAREISEPLSKVEKIVLVNSGEGSGIGASKITNEVTTILAQLPTVIESLSGVDLKKVFEKLSSGEVPKQVSDKSDSETKPKKS